MLEFFGGLMALILLVGLICLAAVIVFILFLCWLFSRIFKAAGVGRPVVPPKNFPRSA